MHSLTSAVKRAPTQGNAPRPSDSPEPGTGRALVGTTPGYAAPPTVDHSARSGRRTSDRADAEREPSAPEAEGRVADQRDDLRGRLPSHEQVRDRHAHAHRAAVAQQRLPQAVEREVDEAAVVRGQRVGAPRAERLAAARERHAAPAAGAADAGGEDARDAVLVGERRVTEDAESRGRRPSARERSVAADRERAVRPDGDEPVVEG